MRGPEGEGEGYCHQERTADHVADAHRDDVPGKRDPPAGPFPFCGDQTEVGHIGNTVLEVRRTEQGDGEQYRDVFADDRPAHGGEEGGHAHHPVRQYPGQHRLEPSGGRADGVVVGLLVDEHLQRRLHFWRIDLGLGDQPTGQDGTDEVADQCQRPEHDKPAQQWARRMLEQCRRQHHIGFGEQNRPRQDHKEKPCRKAEPLQQISQTENFHLFGQQHREQGSHGDESAAHHRQHHDLGDRGVSDAVNPGAGQLLDDVFGREILRRR